MHFFEEISEYATKIELKHSFEEESACRYYYYYYYYYLGVEIQCFTYMDFVFCNQSSKDILIQFMS